MAYGVLHTAQYRPAAAKPERRAVTRSETFIIPPPNPKKLHIHPFIAVPDSQSGATFAVSDSKYGAGFVTADFTFFAFASADLQSAAQFAAPFLPQDTVGVWITNPQMPYADYKSATASGEGHDSLTRIANPLQRKAQQTRYQRI